MSLMDTLTPQTPIGALLKTPERQSEVTKKRNEVIRRIKIKQKRDAVRFAKARYDRAVKEFKEALNENLP